MNGPVSAKTAVIERNSSHLLALRHLAVGYLVAHTSFQSRAHHDAPSK
jgi:hypothetical protein